jgi:hypothetical protein
MNVKSPEDVLPGKLLLVTEHVSLLTANYFANNGTPVVFCTPGDFVLILETERPKGGGSDRHVLYHLRTHAKIWHYLNYDEFNDLDYVYFEAVEDLED